MADPARAQPAFVSTITSLTESEARDVLSLEHPDYAERKESWGVLLDAFEGTGGFLSGEHLWEYPREDSADYDKRKAMARYHNYLESLVDLYVRFLFTQGVKRSSASEEYNAWLENVDGAGLHLNDLLKRALSFGLVAGHAGILIDKTSDKPKDQTKAGDVAKTIASVFYATAVQDWRFARNVLTAVKLREAPPPTAITAETPTGEDAVQYLIWGADGWARFDAKGGLVGADVVDLGLVPLVVLRPKPSHTSDMLGRPLISNANIIRALFNRASEEDEVIRGQAFSVFTVEVPENGDVAQAKEDIGNAIGTSKAIVVRGKATYQTPDQNVPGAIRENIAYLVQELYRAAHVRFRRDTLVGESAESIRLQYTELNEMLQGHAKALAACEQQIARAWFAWNAATPEQAEKAFAAAKVEATYPDEFFIDALITDLDAWMEALRLGLGPTMAKRIKKKAVRRIDPDIPPEELDAIDAEIDAMQDEPPASDTGDPEAKAIVEAALNV